MYGEITQPFTFPCSLLLFSIIVSSGQYHLKQRKQQLWYHIKYLKYLFIVNFQFEKLVRDQTCNVLCMLIHYLFFVQVPMMTTESGLQYKDIKVGEGPSPPIGFQVYPFWPSIIEIHDVYS